jgi:hypothetical protein
LGREGGGAEVESDSIAFGSVTGSGSMIGFGSAETVGAAGVAACGAKAISVPLSCAGSCTGKLDEDFTELTGSDGRACAAVLRFAPTGRLGE